MKFEKPITSFYDYILSCINIKKPRYSKTSLVHQKKIKKHTRVVRMDKKRLKITIKVLNDVKQEYPETRIEERLEEECSKENISVEEVIFYIL